MSDTDTDSPIDSYQLKEPLSCDNENSSNSTFYRSHTGNRTDLLSDEVEIKDLTERLVELKSLQSDNRKECCETQENERSLIRQLEESLKLLRRNSDNIAKMKSFSCNVIKKTFMKKIEENTAKMKLFENAFLLQKGFQKSDFGTDQSPKRIQKIQDLVKNMEVIGHGGEGRVFRGTMLGTNEKVVVKSYFLDCEPSSRIEFAIMTMCSHIDGVKKVLGLYQTDQNSYLIFSDDHFSVPLDLVAEKINLVESEIQFIFSQIVLILNSLKSAFVKHRDIKLDNFLLNVKTGKLCIIDFGWSMYSGVDNVTLMEVRRSGETLMGTFDYLPPEMNSPPLTIVSYEKASVFALGCILLELFCGYIGNICHQLMRENLNTFLQKVMIQKKIKVSKGAMSVLEKCLKMNLEERFNLEDLSEHPWVLSERTIALTSLKEQTRSKGLLLSKFLEPRKKF